MTPRERFFALSPDLLAVAGADGLVVAANPAWKRVLGVDPDALVGQPLRCDDHPRSDVWLRWTVTTDPDSGLTYAVGRDASEERRLADAQHVAKVGSWEWDLRTGARHYTREMYEIQGIDPDADEPWGMDDLLERVDPAHHERLLDARERMRTQDGPAHVEYRQIAPVERWVSATMEAIRGADGNSYMLRGISQDVTAQHENERRLAEAERLADIGSFEWRVSDGAVVWSEGTYRLFGMDPSEAPLTQAELMPLALPAEVARWREVLSTTATGTPWGLEFSIPAPGGAGAGGRGRRVISVRGEAYMSGADTYVRGTMQDVTAARRVARQQQAIARLGQLALATNDLKVLFGEVVAVALDLLAVDVAHVLALQGDGSFAYAAKLGLGDDESGTAIPAGRPSIVRTALERSEPVIVDDWLNEPPELYSPYLRGMGLRSTATVVVRSGPEPFGVIALHSRAPGVAGADQNAAFLDALASFLATAIERLRHETEIGALATLRGRLVAENLEAEERVRQRISEQLHDGVLQDLLAARQDLVEAADGDPAARDDMLRYAREGVERAVALLREAVHALHPVVLQHGGLEAALRAAADQAARLGGFRAEVAVDPAATGMRDELLLSLARELLANAAKHAEAGVVQVTVAREDERDGLLLEVSDDGRGLDAAAVAAAPMNGHIGLASLTQRVEAVGGTLELGSGAGGRGTRAAARLPAG